MCRLDAFCCCKHDVLYWGSASFGFTVDSVKSLFHFSLKWSQSYDTSAVYSGLSLLLLSYFCCLFPFCNPCNHFTQGNVSALPASDSVNRSVPWPHIYNNQAAEQQRMPLAQQYIINMNETVTQAFISWTVCCNISVVTVCQLFTLKAEMKQRTWSLRENELQNQTARDTQRRTSTLIMRICRVVCKLSSSMSSCLMFGLFIIILLGILQKLYVYIQHADMCLHKWPSVTFYLELRQVNLRFKLGWVTTESLQNQHTHTQTKKNLWENTTQLNFGHWEMSLIHRMSMLPPLDNHPSCHLTSGGCGGNMSLENTCKHLL